MELYAINLFATPVLFVAGCVLWYRYDRPVRPGWRRWFVGAGLLSCGANLVLFIKWQVYMHGSFDPFIGAVMRQQFHGISGWLTVFGLACAIAGKGKARGVLALASVMGLFIWVVPVIV